ncbi:MAG: flavodoxin family protein [Bacteroidales bacterium]|nr:flavodoxin family protein [Bacteroidales bacterium]
MMKKIFLMLAAVAATMMLCRCTDGGKSSELWNKANPLVVNYSETTVNPKDGKYVLVVSGSPRRGGNTDLLADEFARGASEAGGNVEKIFLGDYDLTFLTEEGATSPKNDDHTSDAWKLVEKFLAADVVVLAAPVYYMSINDRMKTFLDATYLAWGDERMGGKEYYYITACAQNDVATAECAFQAFRGLAWCMPSATERGYVRAIGMGRKAAVKQSQYMDEAYELGKTINK